MTPNEQIIFAAFIQSLSRFDRKLPADLQGQLNQQPDVPNALELERLIKTNPDLAILYGQECDRLMAEASDREKGFFPNIKPDPSNIELANYVEQICHAPDSAQEAKELLKSEATGGVIGFLKQIFTR